ncbi:uncharacterized protein LOC129234180 [Uloborus diversus]|uniref:uncharacterized protein LOC129234180 n=1 Tax=Uloborus diversus TaxID=327109 RepID=UPI002409E569|nr:uncharacterized protein LOC129234180 [Uloborus diversus]
MDEKETTVEVSRSAVLEAAADMRESCENACSLHTGSRETTKEVSMPICFLVKEQAKSMVAIQELQKRVENVEVMQDDVIESLIEIRNFLCGESRITSNLSIGTPSFTNSPNVLKSSPLTKTRRFNYSPSNLKSSLETSSLSVRSKSVSPKYSELIVSELKKPLPCVSVQSSQKLFDLARNKDSVLESDKQDSGLDSDCREQNDIHHSLGKNWGKQETNDELLQLLDEISERSEILQKQLFVVEENVQDIAKQEAIIDNSEQMESKFIAEDIQRSRPHYVPSSASNVEQEKKEFSKKMPSNSTHVESVVPTKNTFTDASVLFERKPICERVSKIRKTTSNKIDSAMVSSVLKETNVIELQRQVLIYLVENAVLQTKLGEIEQCLYNKNLESEKVENSLKDETRLLMMENRELRIGLDEQKCEIGSLKSKITMLERVLQSVTVENRELNWQLGESLGLQNLSRRDPHHLSSSFTFGSSGSKSFRRSSLPHQFSGATERHVPCTKSKLLSNTSSCLDATVEEPDQGWQQLGGISYKFKDALSSTPMMPLAKLKDSKKHFLNAPNLSCNQAQPNFQTVKRHLKCNSEKNSVSSTIQMCLEENASETKANGAVEDAGAAKFPFNTILEKLKANSDYRISRRVPGSSNETLACSSTDQTKASSSTRSNHLSPPCRETFCSETQLQSRNSPSQNIQDNKSNTRKGRNIHQRIQDILDRIMAESEEAA